MNYRGRNLGRIRRRIRQNINKLVAVEKNEVNTEQIISMVETVTMDSIPTEETNKIIEKPVEEIEVKPRKKVSKPKVKKVDGQSETND